MMKLFKKLLAPLGLIVIINILFLYYLYSLSNKPRQEDRLSSPIVDSSDISQQEKSVKEPAQDISSLISQGEGSNTKDISSSESEERIKSLIADLESDDLQISQEAADKLTALGKEAVPLLCQGLEGLDTPLKGQIVFILGRIGDKEAIPALLSTIKDENAYIRRNSAEALGKISNEDAIVGLTASLNDEDTGVRERSAWALGEIKSQDATSSLMDAISYEKDDRVKIAAVSALGKIKDVRATQLLTGELGVQSDQLYKNAVVVSLGQNEDPAAVSELVEYVSALKEVEPHDKMMLFEWQEALNIAENVIQRLRAGKDLP